MSKQPIACKGCGALFLRRKAAGADECPVCEYTGKMIQYASGEEARSDWYKRVNVGELVA